MVEGLGEYMTVNDFQKLRVPQIRTYLEIRIIKEILSLT